MYNFASRRVVVGPYCCAMKQHITSFLLTIEIVVLTSRFPVLVTGMNEKIKYDDEELVGWCCTIFIIIT